MVEQAEGEEGEREDKECDGGTVLVCIPVVLASSSPSFLSPFLCSCVVVPTVQRVVWISSQTQIAVLSPLSSAGTPWGSNLPASPPT